MEITELTTEKLEAINKAKGILNEVGLELLSIGAPKPPQ